MAAWQHPFPTERNVHRPLRAQKPSVFLVLKQHNSARTHTPLPILHHSLIQEWAIGSMPKGHTAKPLFAFLSLIRKLVMFARTDLHLSQLNIPLHIDPRSQLLMQAILGLDFLPIDPHSASVIHEEQNNIILHQPKGVNNLRACILFIMQEAYARRLEGSSTIKRSEEYQHINTTILPRERTIQAVGYYNRRKKELRKDPSQEIIINLTNRNAERHDLKNHIETLFKSSKGIDPYISNYIKQIRGEPVFSDNKFTNFNEEQYPLKEDQKVKVVEERYFPLQNYYNYIYDLEINKEIFRIVEEKENRVTKEKEIERSVCASEVENYERSQFGMDEIVEEKQVRDKKIRGFYESRFDSKVRVERQPITSLVKELIPHQQHSIHNQPQSSLSFTVNENTRNCLSHKP